MTQGGKKDGVRVGADGSESTAARREMADLKLQVEARIGALHNDMNGIRGEMGEIKELLRSLVKPATRDTDPRMVDGDAEAEEQMRRRVCALADLDLNSLGIPNQSQQGDIQASNSPLVHLVAPKFRGNFQVPISESPTLNLFGGMGDRRVQIANEYTCKLR